MPIGLEMSLRKLPGRAISPQIPGRAKTIPLLGKVRLHPKMENGVGRLADLASPVREVREAVGVVVALPSPAKKAWEVGVVALPSLVRDPQAMTGSDRQLKLSTHGPQM